MHSDQIQSGDDSVRRVLVLAPHADDETLGMGATIARKIDEGCVVEVAIMTGPGGPPLPRTAAWDSLQAEVAQAMLALGSPSLRYGNLPALCLDHHPGYETNDAVAEVIRDVAPNELYLPYYHDLHRDHAAICYAGIVAARGYLPTAKRGIELVAMYETPTETGLMPGSLSAPFTPNLFVDISTHLDRKLDAWSKYASQQQDGNTPRHPDSLTALARLRGSEIGTTFAEAFQIIRSTQTY